MGTRGQLHGGNEDLEVVGEASYQDALWSLCGGTLGDRIRHDIVAVLIPEPDNPHDANAISVRIEGNLVGYLPRQIAAEYLPGLNGLMSRCGGYVALRGVIVGGGYYNDGPGRLGVWLTHNPADFGITPTRPIPGRAFIPASGTMRTGFAEAWRTDYEDDSYDLSWFSSLPAADRPAIAMLRTLLAAERDPIDRHFQFCELEARLYHARELYETALAEFDDACRQHDAEMDTIRSSFIAKWGKVPVLETYRQMAIRKQKQKDWSACLWWSERGLALYGNNAVREEAVEDLLKRRNRAEAKLEEQTHSTTGNPSKQVPR
jgi:HIRAN domain